MGRRGWGCFGRYQIRFLLRTPLAVNPGQVLEGTLKMKANTMQSYFVYLTLRIAGR